LVSELLQELLI